MLIFLWETHVLSLVRRGDFAAQWCMKWSVFARLPPFPVRQWGILVPGNPQFVNRGGGCVHSHLRVFDSRMWRTIVPQLEEENPQFEKGGVQEHIGGQVAKRTQEVSWKVTPDNAVLSGVTLFQEVITDTVCPQTAGEKWFGW